MNPKEKVAKMLRNMVNISAATCVEALANSFLYRRHALQAELAVGLVIFATQGEATRQAKAALREIYASAGHLCVTSKDADYKNVNKRINVTAALFKVIGLRKLRAWIGENAEVEVLNAVMSELESYQFATLDDVLEHCGRPNNKTARQRAAAAAAVALSGAARKAPGGPFNRRADDIKGAIRIDTKAIHLRIPPTAQPAELLEVATRLIELAKKARKPAARQAATLH